MIEEEEEDEYLQPIQRVNEPQYGGTSIPEFDIYTEIEGAESEISKELSVSKTNNNQNNQNTRKYDYSKFKKA